MVTRRPPFQWLLHRGVGDGAIPFPGLLHFTLDSYLIMLSVKQGGIKHHFLSLWCDPPRNWTMTSRNSNEHSTPLHLYICILLPSSGLIDTAVWMHHLDADKTAGEEAGWQLHKNVASNIKQVQAATPYKAPTIRLPAFHHENYTS